MPGKSWRAYEPGNGVCMMTTRGLWISRTFSATRMMSATALSMRPRVSRRGTRRSTAVWNFTSARHRGRSTRLR